MNVNYEKKAKEILMDVIQSSLEHRTNSATLYQRANESLQKYVKNNGGGYSPKQIDDLAKKLLLSDDSLIKKLKLGCNKWDHIGNSSYCRIYGILERIHSRSTESIGANVYSKKLFVPKESWERNNKLPYGCRCGKAFRGQVNRKPIDLI